MEEQDRFYMRHANELHLPSRDSDLPWLIYERIGGGLSQLVCACAAVERARWVLALLLNEMQVNRTGGKAR
jgi:hypothetical protein